MIPMEIKEEVRQMIEEHNSKFIGPSFVLHFKERDLYLYHCKDGRINLYARLVFQGNIRNWDCYFYSNETGKYEQLQISDERHTLQYVLEHGIKSLAS